jgi:hypothetical protein
MHICCQKNMLQQLQDREAALDTARKRLAALRPQAASREGDAGASNPDPPDAHPKDKQIASLSIDNRFV